MFTYYVILFFRQNLPPRFVNFSKLRLREKNLNLTRIFSKMFVYDGGGGGGQRFARKNYVKKISRASRGKNTVKNFPALRAGKNTIKKFRRASRKKKHCKNFHYLKSP